MIILLLSGSIASGKSSAAGDLEAKHGFVRLRTGRFLEARARAAGTGVDRRSLQRLGDELDLTTDYRWVVDEIAIPAIAATSKQQRWLLDSVRKFKQVSWFRDQFGDAVIHVHLAAPENVLESRYEQRRRKGGDYAGVTPYEVAISHPNEIEARQLSGVADLVVDTSSLSGSQTAKSLLKVVTIRESG